MLVVSEWCLFSELLKVLYEWLIRTSYLSDSRSYFFISVLGNISSAPVLARTLKSYNRDSGTPSRWKSRILRAIARLRLKSITKCISLFRYFLLQDNWIQVFLCWAAEHWRVRVLRFDLNFFPWCSFRYLLHRKLSPKHFSLSFTAWSRFSTNMV